MAPGLWADRRGVVLVEFAFVGVALIMLIMGILHIGFCLYVQSMLDHAATRIATIIETTSGTDPNATGFKATSVCPPLGGLLDCNQLQISLFPVLDFRAGNPSGNQNAGTSRSLMLLRLSYDVPIPTWPVLALTGGSAMTVTATVPFVNEF